MKTLCSMIVPALFLVALAAPATAAPVTIDADTYAVVAYSPSTGKIGWAWNYRVYNTAARVALKNCGERDARVVNWARFGWLVLVVSEDKSYGTATSYGKGATAATAYTEALKELRKHSTSKVTDVIVLCSGDVAPKVFKLK